MKIFSLLFLLSIGIVFADSQSPCSWETLPLEVFSVAPTTDGSFVLLGLGQGILGLTKYDKNGIKASQLLLKQSLTTTASLSVLQLIDETISLCVKFPENKPVQMVYNKDLEFISEKTIVDDTNAECYLQSSRNPGEVLMGLKSDSKIYLSLILEGNVNFQSQTLYEIECANIRAFSGGYAIGHKEGIDLLNKNKESNQYVFDKSRKISSAANKCNFHTYRRDQFEMLVFLDHVDSTNLELHIQEVHSILSPVQYNIPIQSAIESSIASAINVAGLTIVICFWDTEITCRLYSLVDGTKIGEDKTFEFQERVTKLEVVSLTTGGFILVMTDSEALKYQLIDSNFECGSEESNYNCQISPCDICLNLNEYTFCEIGSAGIFLDDKETLQSCGKGCSECTSISMCTKCDAELYIYNNACFSSCPAETHLINASGVLSCGNVLNINTDFNFTADGILVSAQVDSEDSTAPPNRRHLLKCRQNNKGI